jgi:hypothetical protein
MKRQVKQFGQFINEYYFFPQEETKIELGLGQRAKDIAEFLMEIHEIAPTCMITNITTEMNSNPNEPAIVTFQGPQEELDEIDAMVGGIEGEPYRDEDDKGRRGNNGGDDNDYPRWNIKNGEY